MQSSQPSQVQKNIYLQAIKESDITFFVGHERFRFYAKDLMKEAIKVGCLDIIVELEYYVYASMEEAAIYGHIHILDYLKEKGTIPTTAAIDNAAANGHLTAVKWLDEHCEVGCTGAAIIAAAEHGYFNIVEWLYMNKNSCREKNIIIDSLSMAALNGHLQIISWLVDKCNCVCEDTLIAASEGGKLQIVNYLLNVKGNIISKFALYAAVKNEHYDLLLWYLKRYPELCCSDIIILLIEYNNQELIKQIITEFKIKQISDECVMNSAAANGYIDLMKWMARNIPDLCVTKTTMIQAGKNGYLNIVKWLWSYFSDVYSTNDVYESISNTMPLVTWFLNQSDDEEEN